MKRILSLLLAFTLVLGMATPAYAAEVPTVTLTADKTSVEVGDTVTVTVSIDQSYDNLNDFQFDIFFDDTIFEKTSSTVTDSYNATVVGNVGHNKEYQGYTAYFPVSGINTLGLEVYLTAGDVASITFTALKATENAEFLVNVVSITDYDTFENAGTTANAVNATVTVTEPASGGDSGDGTGTVVIPDGAPFTAITADVEGEITITQKDSFDVNQYTGVSHYHVAMPEGATKAYVTYPADANLYIYNDIAYAYKITISEEGYSLDYYSPTEANSVTNDDGTVTVTIPVEEFLLADGYGISYENASDWNPVNLFTFELPAAAHTCVFDQEVATEAYLASAATCTEAATYYSSCTCGEKGTEAFTYGEALGHTYVDGTCTVCGAADPDYVAPGGTVIPDGAPFTAITADVEGEITITQMDSFDVDYYTGVSHYHVALPEGATEAYVTYPADANLYIYDNKAYAYKITISEEGYSLGYYSPTEANSVTNDDGTVTVTIPVEEFLLADGYGISYENASDWSPVNLFTFELPAAAHTCVFDQEVATEAYLASAATCTEAATYYYSCECGEKGTETFTYGEAPGHSYENGTCTVCGAADPDYVAVLASGECGENLTWVLTEDGTLTISGTGDMYTYSSQDNVPWYTDYAASITSVVLPEGMTSITKYAFYGCTGLTSLDIPDTVTTLGTSICSGCTALESVTIGDSVESIGDYAFYNTALKNVVLPDSVKSIGGSSFRGITALESIDLCNVQSIGNYAFLGCTSLKRVEIPSGVTLIDGMTFQQCSALESVTIPDTVTKIGSSAFRYCYALTSIDIPDSVTTIVNNAFGYTGLKSIVIPDSVVTSTTFDLYSAFEYCESLESVTIGSGVTMISGNMFIGCTALKSVTIPATVTAIKSTAFSDCTALTEITFEGNAPTFGSNVFKGVTATAYYPYGDDTWTTSVMQNYGGTITWVTTGHTCVYDQEVVSDDYLASAATCTEAATYYYSCECGEVGTETFTYGEALGHTVETWTQTPQMHFGTCTVCGDTVRELHNTDGWKVTTEATCTEAGVETASCTKCDITASATREIPATGHSYVDGVCSVCGDELAAGYTVQMPEDITVTAGDAISIGITVGHTDGETGYNAFDMSFAYDAAALELTSTEFDGLTVTTGEGTIRIQGYGETNAVNTVPFTLTFKALKAAESTVTVTSAKVDNSGNAVAADAPEASQIDGETLITVTGYTVTLPDDFTGEPIAVPGENYTFSEPDDYYDYDITVTVDGEEVEVTDNGDGSYTIPADKITGEIIVTAEKTGKIFDVTLGGMTGEDKAQYGVDYSATLNKELGYDYTVTITIGGETYTGYSIDGNTYTIPGGDITGDIEFTVTKNEHTPDPAVTHNVTFQGSGAGAAEGNATTVADGGTYTLNLTKEIGYLYSVSYVMGSNESVALEPNEDGTYTIANVLADLVITIEKVVDLENKVEVYEYVNLDGKTMFLVLVNGENEEGKHYAYDSKSMYYSFVYEAYAYLTIEEGEFTKEIAAEKVTIADGARSTINTANYDVNRTGLVDINDAQLVYDIYNGKYDEISDLGMAKFLYADVNASKNVDVNDAVAVVANIK